MEKGNKMEISFTQGHKIHIYIYVFYQGLKNI